MKDIVAAIHNQLDANKESRTICASQSTLGWGSQELCRRLRTSAIAGLERMFQRDDLIGCTEICQLIMSLTKNSLQS